MWKVLVAGRPSHCRREPSMCGFLVEGPMWESWGSRET